MKSLNILAFTFLISILSFYNLGAQSQSLNGKCLETSTAQQIKQLLENKKFYIDFCSTCNPQKVSIRRVDISSVSLVSTDCGQEIKVAGKIVRGVKPPVFGGDCTDLLEVYSPSIPLDVPFETTINPANTYVWDDETKSFASVGSELGDTKVCIKALQLKK